MLSERKTRWINYAVAYISPESQYINYVHKKDWRKWCYSNTILKYTSSIQASSWHKNNTYIKYRVHDYFVDMTLVYSNLDFTNLHPCEFVKIAWNLYNSNLDWFHRPLFAWKEKILITKSQQSFLTYTEAAKPPTKLY